MLSGYLYFAQLYSFQVASPQEALNLVLFMVVAVVVSHLATRPSATPRSRASASGK